jgi:hypothetical protein
MSALPPSNQDHELLVALVVALLVTYLALQLGNK